MKKGHVPVRMCVICRLRAPQKDLTRCVPEVGTLVPDTASHRTGRGWYICSRPECQVKLQRFRPQKRAAKSAGTKQ